VLTLAFDTSSAKGSIAILDNFKVLSETVWDREVSHGELLSPAIHRSLHEAGISMDRIDLIAVGQGPGSFTGVRVAVNTARALAYASTQVEKKTKPVMVFDSAEILVSAVGEHDQAVLTLINAHKNLYFTSSFQWSKDGWQSHLPLQAKDLASIVNLVDRSYLCVGDGYSELVSALPEPTKNMLLRRPSVCDWPQAIELGLLARRSFGKRRTFSWKEVQPLYIRASGAEENLEEKRKAPSQK
jgi:N6-L-threonylcarbamoyladenine synthase/tRNA threonylcarbamoyladenosine biosynthesis protein TsaB